ncbi:MAG: septum formation protein Maf [Flavobacteriales bacterium]|nr:septum formation protein Maf [Flavobacteriales bacterium]|tara:strand:- start:18262 stop:18837 length:576 start_codon:yes stop_codon:yes gene_type:complete
MLKNLVKYNIILASNSIRRRNLLKKLNLKFNIVNTSQKENFPNSLKTNQVPIFLAEKKNNHIQIKNDQLIITADTIVVLNQKILNKPKSKIEAFEMLNNLSKKQHRVITGVNIRTTKDNISFSSETKVNFVQLSDDEIKYYINNYNYSDKAGSYGIQEWIGMIAVKKINGCFYNVMGLPISVLYQNLKKIS